MKPSKALQLHRDEVQQLIQRNRARNPRVFGSVLHGRDTEQSDLDILFDSLPEATLFDLGGLQIALQELLGVRVDLLTPGDLPRRSRDQLLREAIPYEPDEPGLQVGGCVANMLEAARLSGQYLAGMDKETLLLQWEIGNNTRVQSQGIWPTESEGKSWRSEYEMQNPPQRRDTRF
jgi:uncharacterized protein